MPKQLIVSSIGRLRLARAEAWLADRPQAEEVLILGDNLDAARELARRVGSRAGAAFGWHSMTLGQLATLIAAPVLAGRGVAPLGRLGAEAVAAQAVQRLAGAGALGRYAAVAEGPGFVRAIAAVAGELRLAGVAPEALAARAPDLSRLLSAYESDLQAGGFADWSAILAAATDTVTGENGRQRFVGLPTLFLDVSIASSAEGRFVRALCRRAPEAMAVMPGADARSRSQFTDTQDIETVDLDGRSAMDEGGTLSRLQRGLFREENASVVETTSPRAAPAAESEDRLKVFSAPGEARECVEIARRVLDLGRSGLAFDRVAILLRSPEEYRAPLEEALARAGVPAHFARGVARPDPAGRAFTALLRCAAEGLSARRFAEYLSLGQLPEATPVGTPPAALERADRWVAAEEDGPLPAAATTPPEAADGSAPALAGEGHGGAGDIRAPRRWESLLVEAAVIGGRDRWYRRIEGLRQELRRKVAALDVEEEARAATMRQMIEDLDGLAAFALPLIRSLDELPQSADWGRWLDELGALATRALRDPTRVLSVLSELAPMSAVGPVSLAEVLRVLSGLLPEIASPPGAQRYGRVFVGPIAAARGLVFDTVFVPGLAERLFPRKIIEEPILLDELRRQLGADLAVNEDRLAEERLALALAVGAAERQVTLSYPRLDLEQGRPRVPSFYALEAVRAAEGVLPDFAELARRAETATTARLGWPAPADPAEAIDDAEHDLATLDRILARSSGEAGAARYLLASNPTLARALRARYQRWSRRWTAADGLVKPTEAGQAIMERHGFAARAYAPTALQHYAACPYRFFLQAVQRLAPREVPEAIDQLDPLQRGSLIHEIQFELFARLREQDLLPVRPQNLERADIILEAVVDGIAERYRDDLAPAIDRVWQDGVAAIRADLREWLRLAAEDDSGFVPWRFEMSFGLRDRHERRDADPQSTPEPVELDCGIRLRGSIDLVEGHRSGTLRVTDHKTGKADGRRDNVVAGGAVLQPVFYALAAEKLFGPEHKVVSGRLYYCTSTGGFAEQVVPLDETAREAATEVAATIGEAVARSFLPAAPDRGECAWCDYRPVCGPDEERRTKGKRRDELVPLFALRRLP